MDTTLDQLRQERINKLEQIRAASVNPYPYRFEREYLASDVLDNFEPLAESKAQISVAGRIMARRDHGKTCFVTLQDQTGRLQAYVRKDTVGEANFKLFELLGTGDIVGARGHAFRTKTGEITIHVDEFEILSISLRPLPDKWHGLKDVEVRYRQRYVDLIMDSEVRKIFLTRTKIVNSIRRVFNAKGGIEVETPTLQPLYGGASARPFVTHHNTLDMELYMRIADELYLKRLIVGGFDCVYEICKDFRNEGMDRTHNPEFTMVEIYWAYKDYNDMMDLTEELFVCIANEVLGTQVIEYQGERIDLTPPWPRRAMLDLIKDYAGVDIAALDDEGLRAALRGCYEKYLDRGEVEGAIHRLASFNRGNMIEEFSNSPLNRN